MADNKHGGGHHLIPLEIYFKTLSALIVLTALTVGVSYIDFGKANIFVSMGIATTKAALVMMFFMGLKYDTLLNRIVIMSSFLALALFMWLSASDLWTRPPLAPIKVAQAEAISVDELKKVELASAEMVAKGRELFATNCAVCHGPQGNGDGPGGAALNPKPRNFHGPLNAWKNGASGKSIYVTLSYGINGTGMGAYKTLAPQDRWALAHFVRTWIPEQVNIAAADSKYAQAIKEDGIGGDAGSAKAVIPVDLAIERMAK